MIENKESPNPSLFPLDTKIIERLKKVILDDEEDLEIPDGYLEEDFNLHNRLLLDYIDDQEDKLLGSDQLETYLLGAFFTYGVIAHTARIRGLETPTVTRGDLSDSLEAYRNLLGPTKPRIARSLDIKFHIVSRYIDTIAKSDEPLISAISNIVDGDYPGASPESLQIVRSMAYIGAAGVYFPILNAYNRLIVKKN